MFNEDPIAERGARPARRDEREYRECFRKEQPSQTGCPAPKVVLDHSGRAPRWRHYRYCGRTIRSAIDLAPLRRASPSTPACTIAVDLRPERLPSSLHWFHHWRVGRQTRLSFARFDDGYVLRFPALTDVVVSHDGGQMCAIPPLHLPPNTLRHLLLDQALPLALSRAGATLLHASAVHVPGVGALAFAGPAGRGKSTLAAALALRGARILSDDCLALERRAGVVLVQPAYPGLRLWDDARTRAWRTGTAEERVAHYTRKRRVWGGALRFRTAASPLRAVFLLSRRGRSGVAADIRRARPAIALLGLVKVAYLLDIEDRRQLARDFHALAGIVSTVPVLRLRVRAGHARLAAVADAITAFAGRLPRLSGRAAAW